MLIRPHPKVYLLVAPICLASCSTPDTVANPAENAIENAAENAEESAVKVGPWTKTGVKDDFGDLVEGKSAIAAEFKGTMTNSAVANAPLAVVMGIQEDRLFALFYEYGKEPKAMLPKQEFVRVKVKTSDGEVHSIEQFLYNDMMLDNDGKLLQLILTQSSPMKAVVDISRAAGYSSTVYNFEIAPTGLKEAMQ